MDIINPESPDFNEKEWSRIIIIKCYECGWKGKPSQLIKEKCPGCESEKVEFFDYNDC